MKKTIASGMIGLLALGGAAAIAVPSALAQDDTESTPESSTDSTRRERFEERRAEREARRAERRAEVAELLGVSIEDLQAAHEAGQSIADVAAAQGVDVQIVIDALVADAQARLDEKVADGTIAADRAAEISETLVERVTARVNGERPEGLGERLGRGRRGHGGFGSGDADADGASGDAEVEDGGDA